MVDKHAEDGAADFVSNWATYLQGEQTHLNNATRNDKRRAQHDYDFKPKPGRQSFKAEYFGNGRSFPTNVMQFKYVFTNEPVFSFGVVAREGISSAFVGHATAYVLRYETNYQGFFTGAYMAYYVDVRDVLDQSVNTPVKVSFNLTFEGVTVPIASHK